MKKIQTQYWYIHAQINYDPNQLPYSLSTKLLQVIFKTPLNDIFGEIASSLSLDVLKFDDQTRRVILRIPKENYVQTRASLSFLTSMNLDDKNIPCTVSVIGAASCLLSLANPVNPSRCWT